MPRCNDHQVAAVLFEDDVLAGDERPAYANRAARRLMQSSAHEPTARIPVAAGSRTAARIVAAVREGCQGMVPSLGRLEVIDLPDWPRLGLERPSLVLLDAPRQPSTCGLTARQLEVISAIAAARRPDEAAATLGITVAMLRTHLKSIYRTLGVSGLSEALVSLRLSSQFADPTGPSAATPDARSGARG